MIAGRPSRAGHSLVLGTGRRMFPEGVHAPLRLADSMITSKGVIIATYGPVRSSRSDER
jgi:hypothetical protein